MVYVMCLIGDRWDARVCECVFACMGQLVCARPQLAADPGVIIGTRREDRSSAALAQTQIGVLQHHQRIPHTRLLTPTYLPHVPQGMTAPTARASFVAAQSRSSCL